MSDNLRSTINGFFGKEELNHPILTGCIIALLPPIGIILTYLFLTPLFTSGIGSLSFVSVLATVVGGTLLPVPFIALFVYFE